MIMDACYLCPFRSNAIFKKNIDGQWNGCVLNVLFLVRHAELSFLSSSCVTVKKGLP